MHPFASKLLVLALLAPGLIPAASAADKLSKEDEAWLELVGPLLLPSERESFEELRKQDRDEFKKIFWARRDPDPEQARADNAFRDEYLRKVEEADTRYRVLGRKGSQTDCGLVFLLLGEPADVRRGQSGIQPGARPPEDWVYRGEQFAGGETSISFDESCALPRGGGNRFKEQLVLVAQSFVRRPALAYPLEKGKLVSLDDQLPKPSPATALMASPRQDFAVEAETKLMMRGQQGASYVAGLVRGDASGLSVREEAGRRVMDLVIAAEAVAVDGSVPQSGSIEVVALVDEQNRFLASWPLNVPPGMYTLRLGALDPKTEKGSTTNLVFEVPDFSGAGGMGVSPLVLFSEMTLVETADPKDAMGAFTLGPNRFSPPFGNEFRQDESIEVLVFVYGAATDTTGAASVGATFVISKDGKPKSRSQEQVFDTPQAVAAIGPVALSSFEPGEYSVALTLVDKRAEQTQERSVTFTVAGPPEAAAATDPPPQP